jgi:beta-glucosidase/6-phospho-beta-glucosidase/beta-galactosidase
LPPQASNNSRLRAFPDDRLQFAVGIEDTFVPHALDGRRALDEYELTHHYERWHADLALARECGATMIRYGIPWYRVNPEADRWSWDWLDGVVDRLIELELEPIVDLMHYGTPLWLENQFLSPDYPRRVSEYAARVADRYRGAFSLYTPLNEPLINAKFCGEWGIWPPQREGHDGFVALIRSLTRGIVETQDAIRDLAPEAAFVHVEAAFRYVGALEREDARLLLDRRFLAEDLVCGRVHADHPLAPYLIRHGLSEPDLAWFREHTALPDVMGVNYYPNLSTEEFPATRVHHGAPWDPRPRRDDGVEGLEDVVRTWHERYDVPVFVAETSHPGSSIERRLRWLDESVEMLWRLRGEGVPVVGYTWWPLFDMIDWQYREGTDPVERYLLPSGLYELDGGDSLARRPTKLVARFREHAGASGVLARREASDGGALVRQELIS